ncbi:MAG: MFS transporter [Pseudomonadota bacterium]
MSSATIRRWVIMTVLSFSGGIIFLLPFLQEVYYEPLKVALNLNNTQVGSLLSVFGVTAMLSYIPGGWLADKVSPRKLLTSSLVLTGGAGLYFSTFPSYEMSLAIHALWGVTITLLFWGAMIRATRAWARPGECGAAFGILETGRGFGEILSSMALLALFASLGSGDSALSAVVNRFSALILFLGVMSWIFIEDTVAVEEGAEDEKIRLKDFLVLLKMPVIWYIAIVILAAYCAYWGTFRLTGYSTDIFSLSATIAGVIAVGKMWAKPIAAFIAGFASDRFGIAKTVAVLFVILIASFTLFAFLPGEAGLLRVMIINVAVVSLAVFALRGIYFALLDEGRIPLAVTGTAAGMVSMVGFTPDIFMPLLGGTLIDNYPGAEGYRYFFLTVAGICAVGLIASLLIVRTVKAMPPKVDPSVEGQ